MTANSLEHHGKHLFAKITQVYDFKRLYNQDRTSKALCCVQKNRAILPRYNDLIERTKLIRLVYAQWISRNLSKKLLFPPKLSCGRA